MGGGGQCMELWTLEPRHVTRAVLHPMGRGRGRKGREKKKSIIPRNRKAKCRLGGRVGVGEVGRPVVSSRASPACRLSICAVHVPGDVDECSSETGCATLRLSARPLDPPSIRFARTPTCSGRCPKILLAPPWRFSPLALGCPGGALVLPGHCTVSGTMYA